MKTLIIILIALISFNANAQVAQDPPASQVKAWFKFHDACVEENISCKKRDAIRDAMSKQGWNVSFRGIWWSRTQLSVFIGALNFLKFESINVNGLNPNQAADAAYKLMKTRMSDAQIAAIWDANLRTLANRFPEDMVIMQLVMQQIQRKHDFNVIYNFDRLSGD